MIEVASTARLNERRPAMTVERLRLSEDSILCIAGEVAFENRSNLNRRLKVECGMTSGEDRRSRS